MPSAKIASTSTGLGLSRSETSDTTIRFPDGTTSKMSPRISIHRSRSANFLSFLWLSVTFSAA
jgi:hypothetical protein